MKLGFSEHIFDLSVAAALLRRSRWRLLALFAVGLVLGAGSVALAPPAFEARTAFTSAASGLNAQPSDLIRTLAGGQFAALGGANGGVASAAIYPDLLLSSRLLREALSRSTPPVAGVSNRSYRESLGFAGRDSSIAMTRAIRYARRKLKIRVDRMNGLVEIRYRSENPQLAASFLNVVLECLNEFNTAARQSQARSVKEFLDRRVRETIGDLERAEDSLAEFRRRNLRFTNSPVLSLEDIRLQRQVRLAEAMYQSLAQQHELARIDEARDTPTLTIIDPPFPPALPAGPGLVSRMFLMSMLTTLSATAWLTRHAWVRGD